MAQRRLIPLAEQLEDVRALSEVVVGCLRAGRLFPDETANPKELTPVGRRPARVEAPFARFEALLGFSQASGSNERFARGEVGLNQVALAGRPEPARARRPC